MLNNTKKTRFKISTYTAGYLALLAPYTVYAEMEGLAAACIAGILSIVSTYNYGETKRPSGV